MNQAASPQKAQTTLLERLSNQLVPELRVYLERHRGDVEQQIVTGGKEAGGPAGQHYARVVDGLLSSLFHATRVAMQRDKKIGSVVLAAVGSYGRCSLSPFSDLDVRLLAAKQASHAAPMAEALLYPLWDAGLSIGHQVVTTDEMIALARKDLPTATCLLDWREVVGDVGLSTKLLGKAFNSVFATNKVGAFLERLDDSARERHERFGDSVFLLEPDVKNGAGGLRDLDVAHWAARARWQVDSIGDLVDHGVLEAREWKDIEAAMNFAMRVRNRLHLYVRRRADRLGFEQQEQLAADFGYGQGNHAVEAFMSEYYRHARVIERARDVIITRAIPPPRHKPKEKSLGNGFKLTDERLTPEDPNAFEKDPVLALRLYVEAIRRNLVVDDSARQLVVRASKNPEFCRRLRQNVDAAHLFTRLVRTLQVTAWRGGSILRELHEVGLLLAMIPEFAPVVGRVHNDVYHVYTVDVHSIAAVDRLRALCRGDMAGEFPLASRLAAEIARPRALVFATLLHDIGKDLGGKSHSERGAVMARSILERLGLPESEIVEVQHLIMMHLKMYHVATRRDIDDPRTLRDFCGLVHGREGLRELYLLTVADVSTTSPSAMTSWKARMLDDLYVAADEWFGSGHEPRALRLKNVVDGARVGRPEGLDATYLDHFLEHLPERYLAANDPDSIVAHALLAYRHKDDPAVVSVLEISEPYVELGVIVDDKPGTLARICASFSASRVKVVGAQVYSWVESDGRPRALDLFWVRAGSDSATLIKALPKLRENLTHLVNGELELQQLLGTSPLEMRWTNRVAPRITSKVNIDNRSASRHTILEVITGDRRDLLFWLATAIRESGLTIELAKINTEGNRVADVFYLKLLDGRKLTDEVAIAELKDRVLAVLARIEERTPISEFPQASV